MDTKTLKKILSLLEEAHKKEKYFMNGAYIAEVKEALDLIDKALKAK